MDIYSDKRLRWKIVEPVNYRSLEVLIIEKYLNVW